MSNIAIRVEKISKRYRIGEIQRYKALRDTLTDALYAPGRAVRHIFKSGRSSGSSRTVNDFIWALKDVSFEIKHGEVIGVIGRNGAGKSTLLKILSRITEPTKGCADIYGRVGSLLEVGTGFHPELTGRENIFLNGAILGMRRKEIVRKFDEIVAFAEIQKFIDTPVKFFSSGMYVRLAFAVAAHLEPEILLVDEVLAVGDASFQKKCLGKMGEVAKGGRTVLFVSHNMGAVRRLCKNTIWIDQGKIASVGPSDSVVSSYLKQSSEKKNRRTFPASSDKPMCLRLIELLDEEGKTTDELELSRPLNVALEYDINRPVSGVHVICFFYNLEGINVLGTGDADLNPERFERRGTGRYRALFKVPPRILGEGVYTVTVSLSVPYLMVYDRPEHVVTFSIVDKTSKYRDKYHKRRPGVLGIDIPWQVEKIH